MAYYFMARTSKGDYQKIDITKSTCFTKLSISTRSLFPRRN